MDTVYVVSTETMPLAVATTLDKAKDVYPDADWKEIPALNLWEGTFHGRVTITEFEVDSWPIGRTDR